MISDIDRYDYLVIVVKSDGIGEVGSSFSQENVSGNFLLFHKSTCSDCVKTGSRAPFQEQKTQAQITDYPVTRD